MKESQRADHVVIEIRMTHTVNEDSPRYIYTLGDRRRKRKEDFPKGEHFPKREDFPTENHQYILRREEKKKRSDSKDSENPPPQTSILL